MIHIYKHNGPKTEIERMLVAEGVMRIFSRFSRLRAIVAVLRGRSVLYNVSIEAPKATLRTTSDLYVCGRCVIDIADCDQTIVGYRGPEQTFSVEPEEEKSR